MALPHCFEYKVGNSKIQNFLFEIYFTFLSHDSVSMCDYIDKSKVYFKHMPVSRQQLTKVKKKAYLTSPDLLF